MKTKTIELYEYEELPEDIKEKVLQENRHINVEDSWWYEPVEDEWKERLEAEGFRGVKIAFSGFFSQGDGASFTAESVELPTFCKANKALTRFKALFKLEYLSACVKRTSAHYVHENTVRGDVETEWLIETDKCYTLRGELESTLTQRVRELSKQIYRDLESEYYYMTSDEAVIDTLESNEYTFRINGKMENA